MTNLGVANSHLKHLKTNYSRPIVNLNMFKPIIKASLDPTETDLSDVNCLHRRPLVRGAGVGKWVKFRTKF